MFIQIDGAKLAWSRTLAIPRQESQVIFQPAEQIVPTTIMDELMDHVKERTTRGP